MKDLYSNWLMKWMLKKGIPAHKGYDCIGYLGGGCFFLALLPCILIQNVELSGWLGTVCGVLLLLITLCLLVVSGYCTYLANAMWLMLLMFGPCDVIMGLAIDLGDNWRIIFTALGILITGIGIFLTPKQLRNSKKLKPELEAAQKQWQREKAVQSSQKQSQRQIMETPKDSGPKSQSSEIDQLKNHLCVLKNLKDNLNTAGEPDRLKAAQEKYDAAAKELGAYLISHAPLWVLLCRFPGGQPVYMGTDGRMEFFTEQSLAEQAQNILLKQLNLETVIRRLDTPEQIRDFLSQCAHNAFQVLRLDNGSRNPCELWLKDFFPYREDNLIDEKNRSLRHMFHRAKLYSWMLARQKDQNSSHGRSFAAMMMTMRLNGYQELGNTLVYALGNPMPEDRLYATQAALDKVNKWLPGSGYEESTIVETPSYNVKLQFCFVNRPGQQGDIEKGMVCVFTDFAQAKAGQAMFRGTNMDSSIVAITCEELLSQAVQCAGIVVDMQTLGFEIPKAEYAKIDEVRKLDAHILVNLKQSEKQKNTPVGQQEAQQQESAAPVNTQHPKPQLRRTEMKGAWKQFDYQWPHGFGYDYILKNAHWLVTHDLPAQTLTTAEIAGAPEKEHIQELKNCGNLLDCVGRETGVLAVGGFSKSTGCLLKVYWYNQTNAVRIFTAGDVEQSKIDSFADMLFEAKEDTCG